MSKMKRFFVIHLGLVSGYQTLPFVILMKTVPFFFETIVFDRFFANNKWTFVNTIYTMGRWAPLSFYRQTLPGWYLDI